jgi:hypothetical protein
LSPVVRLPSWREVLEGPWALRLRAGATGAWLMRGEADDVPELAVRFVAGSAARTTDDALLELGAALEVEHGPATWEELARAIPEGPLVLLILDSERLLVDDPAQLAGLLGALKTASERTTLRVVFQARELPLETEALLAEFGVAEIPRA